MSVIIKGMEMPENCLRCPIREMDYCQVTSKPCTWTERPPHCPLENLPENREFSQNVAP